jgi:hypothetical protein
MKFAKPSNLTCTERSCTSVPKSMISPGSLELSFLVNIFEWSYPYCNLSYIMKNRIVFLLRFEIIQFMTAKCVFAFEGRTLF